jgi:hypothetical protein
MTPARYAVSYMGAGTDSSRAAQCGRCHKGVAQLSSISGYIAEKPQRNEWHPDHASLILSQLSRY